MAEKNDLTFVDSVNICLSAIGEQPTTGDASGKVTVNTNTNRIVQITSDLLKEVTIDVENRGWDFQATTGTVEGIDITSNKYDWNAVHTVSFKRYVTIRAARVLQARYVTDETLHTFSAAEEAFSYANLQQVDATARLAAQFKLPDSITNLGIEKTDFLAGTVEEKLGYLRMATEVNNTQLVNAQKLRVDEETDLLQQQFLTEQQETDKRTSEKALIDAQELKTDAETELIKDQEALVTQQVTTEIQQGTKTQKEALLITAQELKVDAEKLLVDEQAAKTTAETALIADQEALVTQQALTEAEETTKRTAEKDLLLAQELKVDAEKLLVDQQASKTTAETALIADQEALVTQQALTEAQQTAKVTAETALIEDQEALVTQQTSTEAQNTTKVQREGELLQAQELKTDAETELVKDQEALVTQQKFTEIEETAKRTAEKDLLVAQELQVDAQTAKTNAERNTETRVQRKLEEETDLLEAQESRITGETAYIITAENDYLAVLKGTSVLTSNIFYDQRNNPRYHDKRDSFRMMGVKESDFSAAPAYKKLSMLEEADSFSQHQLSNTTAVALPTARTGGYGYWAVEMYQKLGYGNAITSNKSPITRWLYDVYLNNLYTLGERKLSWTRRTIKLTADSNGRLKAPLSSGFVIGGGRTYNTYTYYRIDGKQLGYETHTESGEDYNILVDLDLDENQSTSFNGEYTVEVGQTMDLHQSNGIAPLFENWVQSYTLLQFVETYPVNATEVEKFRKEEARFRSLMEQEEAELGQYNILDSTDVAQRVGHNRNYNLL
jgi:hypothetical protein